MKNVPAIALFLGFVIAVLFWQGIGTSLANRDTPSEKKIVDVRKMSIKERAELGEKLLFGAVGTSPAEDAIGPAQCALCHGFFKESIMADPNHYPSPPWGPHFFDNFTGRIERLIASPKYRQRPKDTEQPEAFPGSGIATSVIEYLAESNVCPSCYVVPGFSVKDTQDRESVMPKVHKPPISLSIDDFIVIDTWLFVHDGREPPSPNEIEKAYRKFIPESEWNNLNQSPVFLEVPRKIAGAFLAIGKLKTPAPTLSERGQVHQRPVHAHSPTS